MKHKLHQLALGLIALTSSLFISSCSGDNDNTGSTKADITQFVFQMATNPSLPEDLIGDIDSDANTISITVPYGTVVTSLQPTITISEGATIDPEATTQDFSAPVVYTVTAEAGNTKTYTITVTTGIHPDREALLAIYNANPQSQENLGWDINDPDIANWNGVKVTDGRVTELTLFSYFIRDGGLSGIDVFFDHTWINTLPAEIGKLTALKMLTIQYSVLRELPAEIGNLKNLETLDLSFSPYLGELPPEIVNLEQLTRLEISKIGPSFLKEEVPFTQLPSKLCDRVSSGDLEVVPFFDSYCLSDAYLSDREALLAIYNANPLFQENLGWDINNPDIANWNGVKVTDGRVTELFFYLNNNQFGAIPPSLNLTASIGELTKLKKLNLSNIPITGLPDEMGNLKDFEQLITFNSNIREIPSSMGQLQHFTFLSVRRNSLITLVVPEEVCALEKSGQLVIQTGGTNFDGPVPYCSSNR